MSLSQGCACADGRAGVGPWARAGDVPAPAVTNAASAVATNRHVASANALHGGPLFHLPQLITSDVVNTSLAIVGTPPYSPLCRYSALATMFSLIGHAQPRRQPPGLGHVQAFGAFGQRRVAQKHERVAHLRAHQHAQEARHQPGQRHVAAVVQAQSVDAAREIDGRTDLAVGAAAQVLGPEAPPAPRHLQVGAREPDRVGAVERAILRAVHPRHAQLDAHGQRQRDRQPAAGGLAGVAVGLVVEVKRLDHRRAVGQRAGDDQPVAVAEPAAELEPDRRAGGVTRDQRRRDAEAAVRLALRVLDADHRFELADVDRRLAQHADLPLQRQQVDVERVAETEVGAGARQEVHAADADDVFGQRRVERQVELVGDEAGRAVGIDQVLAGDARRIAQVGGLAARVDRGRQDVAQKYPVVDDRSTAGRRASPSGRRPARSRRRRRRGRRSRRRRSRTPSPTACCP